jgi:ketosteroid isomerase-like protein/phenylpyruvate tautomerase PptA (4-oxalocrotonate tautomerase family)
MPVISVTLVPGYAPEAQARLVSHLAAAARSVVPASDAGTTVYVNEASTYRRDGRVLTGGDGAQALPDAALVVRDFLDAVGRRDFEAARQWLAPDFEMVFPGGVRMRDLAELTDWAAGRYQSVRKHYERFDPSWQGEVTAVFCSGTLEGRWLDGKGFEGVRFVDRFELVGGRIRRQEVWNDLAETRAVPAAGA